MITLTRACVIAGLAIAFPALNSCVYPAYSPSGGSGTSVAYESGGGYGDGYGYGGSGFTTSIFVSTGNARWGYDPNSYCYYDYTRRAYYDPYLYGYYPVGYRPHRIYGAPHPTGWRRGYCPPPSRIRNVQVNNYSNRETNYRNTNYSWRNNVRRVDSNQYDNRRNSNLRSQEGSSSRSFNSGAPYSPSSRNNYQGSRNDNGRYDRTNNYDGRQNDTRLNSRGNERREYGSFSQNSNFVNQPGHAASVEESKRGFSRRDGQSPYKSSRTDGFSRTAGSERLYSQGRNIAPAAQGGTGSQPGNVVAPVRNFARGENPRIEDRKQSRGDHQDKDREPRDEPRGDNKKYR